MSETLFITEFLNKNTQFAKNEGIQAPKSLYVYNSLQSQKNRTKIEKKNRSYKPEPIEPKFKTEKQRKTYAYSYKLFKNGIETNEKREQLYYKTFGKNLQNEIEDLHKKRTKNSEHFIKRTIERKIKDNIIQKNKLKNIDEELFTDKLSFVERNVSILNDEKIKNEVRNKFESLAPFNSKKDQRKSSNRLSEQGFRADRPRRAFNIFR